MKTNKTTRNNRKASFEVFQLEQRNLMASYIYDPTTRCLTIQSTQDNEKITLQSNTNNYTVNSSIGYTNTSTPNFTLSGTTLIANKNTPLKIKLTDNSQNSNTTIELLTSTSNYTADLTLYLSNSTAGQTIINNTNTNRTIDIENTNNVVISGPINSNNISIKSQKAITIDSDIISSNSLNITANGSGLGDYPTGFAGVKINNSNLYGYNNLIITGRGPDLASDTQGVSITNAYIETTNGNIKITGYAGNLQGDSKKGTGLNIDASTITSNTGSITLEGYGRGDNTGTTGIVLKNRTLVQANTDILLTGNSGNKTLSAGSMNYGILMSTNSQILGTSNISLNSNNSMTDAPSLAINGNSKIQTTSGTIQAKVTSASAYSTNRLKIDGPSSIIKSQNGSIEINTDSIEITNSATIESTTNSIKLSTSTQDRNIRFSNTSTPIALNILNTQLDRIKTNNLIIGSASSGTITIAADLARSGNITLSDDSEIASNMSIDNLVLACTTSQIANSSIIGNVIVTNGSYTTSGTISGDLTVNNGTANATSMCNISGTTRLINGHLYSDATYNELAIYNGTLHTNSNQTRVQTLYFANHSTWQVDTENSQITANNITIDSTACLVLNIATASKKITLIENTSSSPITGTFENVPNNSIVLTNNIPMTVRYTEGLDQNDMTLTVNPTELRILSGNNQTTASNTPFQQNLSVQLLSGNYPISGAHILFTLPVQSSNMKIASGYFNNDPSSLTANIITDNNGVATVKLYGGVNPGPFNIQPVLAENRSLWQTFNLGVVGLAVQKQSINRSFVRYLDLVLQNPNSMKTIEELNSNITLQQIRTASMSGGAAITPNNLTLSSTNASKTVYGWTIDFGPTGIGSDTADTTTADGVYQITNKAGATAVIPTYKFHRLLGDTNGDKAVDSLDTSLVNTLVTTPSWRYNNSLLPSELYYTASTWWAGDTNGDGRVNATDINITGRWRGRRVIY